MSKNSLRRSPAEKVSFSISLFIVGVVVALVCYIWVTGDNNPPILSVSTFQTRQVNQQYYVPFTVTNFGSKTAHAVEVIGELSLAQRNVEIGKQEIDFLSRQEERSGEFIFSHNPQEGKLTVRVASYKEP